MIRGRTAPRLPSPLLPRPHLHALLGPPGAVPLSVICGPAGAGKTTLVRSWLADASGPWSWLTVDDDTGCAARFWAAVVRAMHAMAPDLVMDVDDLLTTDGVDSRRLAAQLLDDLHGLDAGTDAGRLVVVVDDAHRLDPEAWADVAWLLQRPAPELHLVIVTRADPAIPVARLRALGAVTEVRWPELAFSPDETVQLLSAGRQRMPAGFAGALHERTEGWAAGVRLAMLAIERGAAPEHILASADAAGGLTAELLVAEVLAHRSPEVRSFLRATTVAEVLEPGLCSALTGLADSAELLRSLAAEQVFLTGLEGRTDQFRYHPLLAELLRAELRAADPGAEAALRGVAARWYADQGRVPEAVEQALAGAHGDLALALVTEHLYALYAAGHRTDVSRWILALPEDVFAADVDRLVDHCESLLFLVRPEWLRWYRRAASAVDAGRRPDLAARLQRCAALGRAGQGWLDEFEQRCTDAAELRGGPFGDAFEELVVVWRARLLSLHGRHEEAVAVAQSLLDEPLRLLDHLRAFAILAVVRAAAVPDEAVELSTTFVDAWRRAGEPLWFGLIDALCDASAVALARGDREEAEDLAAAAMAATSEPPANLLWTRSQIATAAVEAAAGERTAAAARLRHARAEITGTDAAPCVRALVEGALRDLTPRHAAREPRAPGLTARETTVLQLLASHRTFAEIAAELFVSRETVKTHAARVYRKLGAHGRSAAIREAVERGLL